MKQYIRSLVLATVLLSGCGNAPDSSSRATQEKQKYSPQENTSSVETAGHIIGAQANALIGNQDQARVHVQAMQKDMLRDMRIPDPARPIEHELALAIIRKLEGVVSTVWLDRGNVLVLVDNATYRNMETIDRVCAGLDPLGDTLAVVVHVQNAHARTAEAADTISRNCRLPPGQSALMQAKRQIDVVDPAIRRAFKAQQKP